MRLSKVVLKEIVQMGLNVHFEHYRVSSDTQQLVLYNYYKNNKKNAKIVKVEFGRASKFCDFYTVENFLT